MKVLIIGAGLGGLCLAHGLRKHGIDAQVFERRRSPADQPASYGIHLDANGLRALHACLPSTNWEALVAAAQFAPDVVRFWSPTLRPRAVYRRDADEMDPITRRRAISRDALRDALLLGLDVQWGKEFTRYELLRDGTVRVQFADGSSMVGDVVVGADGSNSKVRGQRLPHVNRVDLGVINIAGRTPLTAELAKALPPAVVDGGVNNIVPSSPGWMFVSTWRAAAETYIVWAWVGSIQSYPANVELFSPTELRDLVSARVDAWSPAVRQIVALSLPASVARIPLRTMPMLEAWDASPITLLGDAIHNMTPMAGIGANTALRDAQQFTRAFSAPGGVVERIAVYEGTMRAYANDALAMSTRNALNAASEAWLNRAAFRVMLRVASGVTLLNQLIFAS